MMEQQYSTRWILSFCCRRNIKHYIIILFFAGLSFAVIWKYIRAVSELEKYTKSEWEIHIKQGQPIFDDSVAKKLDVYNVITKHDENIECKKLETIPPTSVCLHNSSVDRFISGNIENGRGWELDMVEIFQDLLREDEEFGLLDLGANIGVYSLVAAAMNRSVLSVEPVEGNLKRFAKAVQMNGYQDLITVLPYAITDIRTKLSMSLNPNNQGAHRLVVDKQHDVTPERKKVDVETILMNDLEPYIPFKKAIMKIDIEGQEHKAFVHSKELMDKVEFPYIFMEWMQLSKYNKTGGTEDNSLTLQLIDMLTGYGYTPFETVSFRRKPRLRVRNWGHWPIDIIWSKKDT